MTQFSKQQIGILQDSAIAVLARKQRHHQAVFFIPYCLQKSCSHPVISTLAMPKALDLIVPASHIPPRKKQDPFVNARLFEWFGISPELLNYDYKFFKGKIPINAQHPLYVCACKKSYAKKLVQDYKAQKINITALTTLSHALFRLLCYVFANNPNTLALFYTHDHYSYLLVIKECNWLYLNTIANLSFNQAPPLQPWLDEAQACCGEKNIILISPTELAEKLKLSPEQLPAAGAALWRY